MESIHLFSNFNLGIFSGLLKNHLQHEEREYFENSIVGLEILHQYNSFKDDISNNIGFSWFSPESISPSFNSAIHNETYSKEEVLQEFHDYFSLVSNLANKCGLFILPTFHQINYERNFGILDLRKGLGIKQLLGEINSEMINFFHLNEDIFILDHDRWIHGAKSFAPRMWFGAKVPFQNSVFEEAVLDIETILNASKGLSKKLLILDLDNTLWGGVVGDDGWENLRLGGHDEVGEAYSSFQRNIKNLSNKGIILALCSKNTEQVALNAISSNQEMILRIEDFSALKINWEDKAGNIKSLCAELNIGTDSAVFLDDNINERERVKSALPEVFVPDLPKDPRLFSSFLSSLRCFDGYALTDEDKSRKNLYHQRKMEQQSRSTSAQFQSQEDWLLSLNICMQVEPLNSQNISRVVQLMNKTNQMNLSTRRLNKEELMSWVEASGHYLWSFRVSDRFGDAGLTGIASIEIKDTSAQIVDFILSCRVMGKEIEQSMLYFLSNEAIKLNLIDMWAQFKHTDKNKPCYDFWKSSCFEESKKDTFTFQLKDKIVESKAVRIQN